MCVDFQYQTNSVPCLSDNSLGADVWKKREQLCHNFSRNITLLRLFCVDAKSVVLYPPWRLNALQTNRASIKNSPRMY